GRRDARPRDDRDGHHGGRDGPPRPLDAPHAGRHRDRHARHLRLSRSPARPGAAHPLEHPEVRGEPAARAPRRRPEHGPPAVTPLDVAARLLARTPRTEADLEARLVRLGYRRETAAAAVARCRELGWVGDAAYARERASALRARGAGSLKIAADLAARGLPQAVGEAAVAESLA